MAASKSDSAKSYPNSILDSAGALFIALDKKGDISFVNHKGTKVLGYNNDEIVGKNWFDSFLSADIAIKAKSDFDAHLSGENGACAGNEHAVVVKSGEIRNIAWQHTLLRDNKGCIIGILSCGEDITERAHRNKEKSDSEKRYQSFFENNISGVYLSTPAGRLLDCNPAFFKMFGYKSKQDILKLGTEKLYPHPTNREQFLAQLQEQKKLIGFSAERVKKNGTIIHCVENVIGIFNDNDELVQFQGFICDISKYKKSERAFKKLSSRLSLALNAAELGVWQHDLANKRLVFDERMLEIYGLEKKKFSGHLKEWMACLHPEDRTKAVKAAMRSVRSGDIRETEFRIIRPDGEVRQIKAYGTSWIDKAGVSHGGIGVNQDITEQRQTEKQLLQREKQFRFFFNNASIGMYRTTKEGKILMANPAIIEMLGYASFDELADRDLNQGAFEPEYNRSDFILHMEKKGRIIGQESTWLKRDGTKIHIRESATSVRNDAGDIIYYEGTVEDITEHKQAESALQESRRQMATLMSNLPGMAYQRKNDDEWTMMFVSDGCRDLTGYKSEELVDNAGIAFADLIHPQDRQMVRDSVREALDKKQNFQLTYRIISADKKIKWVWEKGREVFGTEKNVVSLEGFIADISELKKMENEKEKLFDDNNERLKEMKLLYLISQNSTELNQPIEDFLQKTVERIPAAWHYPEETCARIFLNGNEYKTDNFTKTKWMQTAPIHLNGKKAGVIDVCYLKEMPESDKGPFLKEEQNLIKSLANHIENFAERKQSEARIARYGRIFKDSLNEIYIFDADTLKFSDVNRAAQNNLGYTLEELQALTPLDIKPDATTEWFEKLVAPLRKNETDKIVFETVHERKDHSRYNVEVHLQLLKLEHETLFSAFILDISERKRAETALRESEAQYRALIEQSQNAIYLLYENKFEIINPQFTKLFGYTQEETQEKGFDFKNLLAEKSLTIIKDRIHRQKKGEELEPIYEFIAVDKNGREINCEVSTSYVDYRGGRATQGIIHDITERKQAEEALRESELKYSTLVENANEAIVVAQDGVLKFSNSKTTEITGFCQNELRSKPFVELIHKDDRDLVFDRFQKRLKGLEIPDTYSFRLSTKSGQLKWVNINSVVISWEGRAATLNFLSDITDSKQAEEELRKLTSAVEQSSSSIVITDTKGIIEYVNPRFCHLTGYSETEAIGQNPRLLQSGQTSPELFIDMWHTITGGKEWRGEFVNRKKNGDLFWETASISPIKDKKGQITHFLGIKEDITEQKKLEEQLRQSQKMEAIGTLAGGVAHDFNNLLTVINGYTELLMAPLHRDDPIKKRLQQIRGAGKRAASLTGQLLAFSRKQLLKPEVLDINTLISDTEKMLKRLIGENIDLQTLYQLDLSPVEADSGQIEQIIINLAVNARDALPNGGNLTIETQNVYLDESFIKQHKGVNTGYYVMIAVSDNGIGMDKSTQSHIFDPFFTTKAKGKGTGLGLSTVYGIVKQSGGHIWVYSEPGHGACFKIYLPTVDKKIQGGENLETQVQLYNGDETILLVEDEEDVRLLAEQALNQLGYHLITAADGEKGLQKLVDYKKDIHLLLADVIMPNMSGRQLGERIGDFHPETKICYMSGYTDDAIANHGVLEKGVNLLQKPFSLHALARKVRKVLDEV